jgi:formate dehydrogenase iron-sulfur subunit
MSAQTLQIRRSSASLWGGRTGMRQLPVVSKYIDTSTCIGCKACEVACQEWNDLGPVPTEQTGTYQTMPALDPEFWNLIRFNEQEFEGGVAWLMRKDQCMHCEDPGCLAACPAPGAIVQYENGIVDVNPEQCIGCVKACPTGCLTFGTKDDMVARGNARVKQLREGGFANAALYNPAGVGGTGVVTVLAHGDKPDWYGLPSDPHVPTAVRVWKSVLRPLGLLAIFGAVLGTFGHFMNHGPKEARETER